MTWTKPPRSPFLCLLPAAILSLILPGCGGLGEREADLFERSKGAIQAGEWAAAESLLTLVLEAEPRFTPARLARGKALFELGKHRESLKDLGEAQSSGDLEEDELFDAILHAGRSWIEIGRSTVPDPEALSAAVTPERRREARDCFLKANAALLEAGRVRAPSYEASLWRGYVLYRLENHRKALEVLGACDALGPDRWEHRFFGALAWEGIYRVNTQSLETYFAIVEAGPRPELAPVYDHLAALSPEVAPAVAARILKNVEAYAAAVPSHPARIDEYLAGARARRDSERRQARLASLTGQVRELAEKERFEEAVSHIQEFLKEEGEGPEASRLLRETQEAWSLVLEARMEPLMSSGEKEKLELALRSFEQARNLTGKVDRLVVLQQKINAVQLLITRQETSRRIQDTYELLRAGRHRDVLRDLGALSPDGLTERDRDLYHYLRGSSAFHLGQWPQAARSFASIGQRTFENLDACHGLALVRSGQETTGIALLANIPAEGRGDEVNRVLGHHYGERGDFRKASLHLSAVKEPAPRDLESLLQARREVGLEHYRKAEYSRAAEELQEARQILEKDLHRKALDVYLYLGHSYFHLEDFARAGKAYQDLSETDLTGAEREQCRDLFLHRAQIRLREKSPDLAHRDLAEFIRLGGQIPPDLAQTHGRLVATYADFMPLDRIQYWNYASTGKDYNYTLFVKDDAAGGHRVERREAGNASEEVWTRQGIYLTKQVGESIVKLPLNLNPAEEALPYVEYQSQGQACTAEVVAIQQGVELPGGRKFTDCLKVRVRRAQKGPGGDVRFTRHIFYFAPGIGEVKQEIYRDDTRVSEIVLSDYAFRVSTLGN